MKPASRSEIHCLMTKVLDCWNLSAGAECQVGTLRWSPWRRIHGLSPSVSHLPGLRAEALCWEQHRGAPLSQWDGPCWLWLVQTKVGQYLAKLSWLWHYSILFPHHGRYPKKHQPINKWPASWTLRLPSQQHGLCTRSPLGRFRGQRHLSGPCDVMWCQLWEAELLWFWMFFRSRSDSARWICQGEWVLTSRGDDKSSNSRISQISHHHSLKKTVVSARFLCQFGQELTDSLHLPTNYSQTIPKSVDFSHLSHVFLRCFHENRGNGPATWPRIVARRSCAVKHWTGHGWKMGTRRFCGIPIWWIFEFESIWIWWISKDVHIISYPKWSTDDYGRTLWVYFF